MTAPEQAAQLWGQVYQTTQSAKKNAQFVKHVEQLEGRAPEEEAIVAISSDLAGAFAGDIGMNPVEFSQLMRFTAYHESLGGKFDTQQGGGPARGWWQVETATAQDILKNSSVLIGPKAEAMLSGAGVSKEKLEDASASELSELLKNPVVSGVFGAARYVQGLQGVSS